MSEVGLQELKTGSGVSGVYLGFLNMFLKFQRGNCPVAPLVAGLRKAIPTLKFRSRLNIRTVVLRYSK